MDKNMADRLIELREKNHLSQSAVTNRLGVTPALISAYEKTERNPSLERLIALADIHGLYSWTNHDRFLRYDHRGKRPHRCADPYSA